MQVRSKIMEAGETAPRLKALAALPEDPGFNSPATKWQLTTVTPVPGAPATSSGIQWALHGHGTQTCRQNTYTHQIK